MIILLFGNVDVSKSALSIFIPVQTSFWVFGHLIMISGMTDLLHSLLIRLCLSPVRFPASRQEVETDLIYIWFPLARFILWAAFLYQF
jgi:hypothetical protein